VQKGHQKNSRNFSSVITALTHSISFRSLIRTFVLCPPFPYGPFNKLIVNGRTFKLNTIKSKKTDSKTKSKKFAKKIQGNFFRHSHFRTSQQRLHIPHSKRPL
jgi:hypothetical protein